MFVDNKVANSTLIFLSVCKFSFVHTWSRWLKNIYILIAVSVTDRGNPYNFNCGYFLRPLCIVTVGGRMSGSCGM